MGAADIINPLMTMAGGIGDDVSLFLANQANEQRQAQGWNEMQEFQGDWTGPTHGSVNQYKREQSRYAGMTGDVGKQYGKGMFDRYTRGMGLLKGMGDQEMKDINTRFNNMAGGLQQDMVGRGLTGSTVMPGMRMGLERERSDALGSARERIRAQTMAADAGLSGDALQAQRSGAMMGIDATSQASAGNLNATMNLRGMDQNMMKDRLNWISQKEDSFQQTPLSVYEGLGRGASDPPNMEADSSGLWGPAASTGGAALGAFTTATIMAAGVCISGDSQVRINHNDNTVHIDTVKTGDLVFDGKGWVGIKEVGVCPADQHNSDEDRWRKLVLGDGRSIKGTTNHIVEGLTIKLWANYPNIARVLTEDPFDGYDLILSGGDHYEANGLKVQCMGKE